MPSRKKNAISRKTIDDLFRKYAKKARLPADKWHVHTLQHSIAVHMLDAGHSQEEAKDQVGHKRISSTDVYAAISGRQKKADIRKHGTSKRNCEFLLDKVYPHLEKVA